MTDIDWQRVVLNLRNHYKPLATVAKELNLNDAHLQRLARGEAREPRFNSGIRLLNLHEKVCKSLHTLEHIGR
jgi:hypothetical protein